MRPPWLEDLLEGSAYPGGSGESVELIQTHASFVFLVGQDVYKMKKSIRTPFLDYSTERARELACEEEVRINRSLAPGIYLGTLPVVENPRSHRVRVGGEGKRIDTVVHMRRVPDGDLLSARIASERVTPEDLRVVGRHIARFHAEARRGTEIDRASETPAIGRLVLENLEQSREAASALVDFPVLGTIEGFFRGALGLFGPILEDRVRAGRALDGHGDLRLEHVSLEALPPAILDRIEFDPVLRFGDVALDLSFLVLELREAGRADLARVLVEAYEAQANDPELRSLLDLFSVHRALVRAKVEAIRSSEEEIEAPERRRSRERAGRLFRLSAELARPLWIAMSGLPGSGKSTVARALGLEPDAWLRTDQLREGIDPEARYTLQGIALAYRRLRSLSVERASRGGWTILDGAFGARAERDEVEADAERAGADLLWIECRCPDRVADERIDRRVSAGTDPSEADRSVRVGLAALYEPLTEVPDARRLVLSTVGDEAEVGARARRWLFRARPIRVLEDEAST